MKKIQQIYDATVAHDDYGNTYEKIRGLIDFSGQNLKILDVGCSAGEVTKELTEKHYVCGIEISEQAAKKARENGLQVIVHDLNSGIPEELKNDRFDIILFNDILEHLINVESTLKSFIKGNLLLKKYYEPASKSTTNSWIISMFCYGWRFNSTDSNI